MDGGVIQQASSVALEAGATPAGVMATLREAELDIPVALMTYVNPVLRRGVEGFLDDAAEVGVSGIIVPDLPVDESDAVAEACVARDIDAVLLAAPGTAPARLAEIGERASGFVYCVATYGVTGARSVLETTAQPLVDAMRPLTDLPAARGRRHRHARAGPRGIVLRRRGGRGERPDGVHGRGGPLRHPGARARVPRRVAVGLIGRRDGGRPSRGALPNVCTCRLVRWNDWPRAPGCGTNHPDSNHRRGRGPDEAST